MSKKLTATDALAAQEDYVATFQRQKSTLLHEQEDFLASFSGGVPLANFEQMVDSMRQTRYKDEAAALMDLVDNSLEAGARQVIVGIHASGKDKVDSIAVLDDGVGMIPGMVGASLAWGATTRKGRNGFGRFGFGLKNASIKYGRKFTVYSRIEESKPFMAASLDLDELRQYVDSNGLAMAPMAQPALLPEWIEQEAERNMAGGVDALRTVVVWERLEPNRLNSKTVGGLTESILRQFGVVYRSFIGEVAMKAGSKTIEAIDPLFTTPNARFHDVSGTIADPLPSMEFELLDQAGTPQPVTIRMSRIGHDAWNATTTNSATGREARPRLNVRNENHGIAVCRNGRQIEVIKWGGHTWDNYSKQVGVEINFPAELDELFGVTPDKQTIVFTEVVNRALSDLKLSTVITREKMKCKAENDQRRADSEKSPQGRPSERAMAKLDVIRDSRKKKGAVSKQQQQLAEQSLKDFVKEKAKAAGVTPEVIEPELRDWTTKNPYVIEFVDLPGADFYIASSRGAQTVVKLNTAHPFFTAVYAKLRPDQADVRAGLELLLATLARAEVDAFEDSDRKTWYMNERREWSRDLEIVLTTLPMMLAGTVESGDPMQDLADPIDEGDQA